ncbi:MAG TPA: PadR family transcriptional regulator [Gemmatimonadaceae bacterium]|jgi:transcriptional regulator|nr:PadR family transcriptional regulator [Gemmatimonadaceae bacterium]
MTRPPDLVQGTLGLLLLKLLALQPMNGWAIGQQLNRLSRDDLKVTDGSVYQALHRLEQEGWIRAEWRQSENNRRAKFYSLTRLGKRRLAQEMGEWERLSSAIGRVMRLRTVDV